MAAGSAAFKGASNRILPNQLFNGFVNGQRPTATVVVDCSGGGPTGHPVAGQHVSVQRSLDIPGGNTGANGSSIVVTFRSSQPVTPGIVLTHYTAAQIPTSLTLPCSGSGVAVFRPRPTSETARPDFVTVNFVSSTT
jgi:hypothetical protein